MQTTESSAQIHFAASIAADTIPGYPFSLEVAIRYVITAREIALSIQGTNTGPGIAPYGVGWHPYFTLGTDHIDDLKLMIPAAGTIQTRDLIPLDGEDAFSRIDRNADLDFRHLRTIGNRQLDLCFTDLARDSDGYSHSVLINPASGTGLRISQERGLVHVYTGDSLSRDPRRSVALEPVELMTNAFNRPDCYEGIALKPAATRAFRCTVDIIGDAP